MILTKTVRNEEPSAVASPPPSPPNGTTAKWRLPNASEARCVEVAGARLDANVLDRGARPCRPKKRPKGARALAQEEDEELGEPRKSSQINRASIGTSPRAC